MMFGKPLDPNSVKNILVISLTNIGDVVLTCPVADILLRDFPSARVTVITGPNAAALLEGNARLRVVTYNKHMGLLDQVRWFLGLRRTRFDLIVDLRNTALPFLISARGRTWPQIMSIKGHLRQKHLERLRTVHHFSNDHALCAAIVPKPLADGVLPAGPFVLIAPTAADSAKRWTEDGFAKVADFIASKELAVVFTGGAQDRQTIDNIHRHMKNPSISLAGQLDLRELAFALSKAAFAIVHDSGAMHIAGYFHVPVIALYGPTDDKQSGPLDHRSVVIRRNDHCPRCLNPQARGVPHQCMAAIQAQDVIDVIQNKFC